MRTGKRTNGYKVNYLNKIPTRPSKALHMIPKWPEAINKCPKVFIILRCCFDLRKISWLLSCRPMFSGTEPP